MNWEIEKLFWRVSLLKSSKPSNGGNLDELLTTLEITPPRGEYVILLERASEDFEVKDDNVSWEAAALELSQKTSLKEAAREIALSYHLSRREVYQYLLNQKEDNE